MNVRVGDILEIPTANGMSYVLVIFDYTELPRYGKLVKAFNKKFDSRPPEKELKELVKGKESFLSFVIFITKDVEKLGITKVINIGDQGYNYDNLPKMWIVRQSFSLSSYEGMSSIDMSEKKLIPKKIVLTVPGDSKNEIYFSDLSTELIGHSQFSVSNVIALKERIEQNYSPEKDLKFLWEKVK